MRIAFITNGYPLISEAFIQTSALELLRRGHAVDVIAIGNARATGYTLDPEAFAGLPHAYASASWSNSWLGRAISLPKAGLATIQKHGFGALGKAKPSIYRRTFSDLTLWSQLAALPKNGRYDILHCQFAPLAEFVMKHVRAGFLDGHIISHFRGYDISEVVQSEGPGVYNTLWPNLDGFIANCGHFADRARSLGCPEDRLTVIGSGIDLNGFTYAPPRPFNPGGEPLRCVMVGRLIARKGFDLALKALAQVRQKLGIELEVEIIGDGTDRSKLMALIDNLELHDVTRLSGKQPHDYIARQLTSSHLLLAPSRTTSQGGQDAPVNSLKEAMATGTITVASKHGGIPELVREGETGFLGDEDDAASLAAAIERAIAARNEWPRISQNALTTVRELCELSWVTERQIAFYEECLERPRQLKK